MVFSCSGVEKDGCAIITRRDGANCAASDAQFVATAQALGTKLLTEDKELLLKFPGLAVGLKTFASSA